MGRREDVWGRGGRIRGFLNGKQELKLTQKGLFHLIIVRKVKKKNSLEICSFFVVLEH